LVRQLFEMEVVGVDAAAVVLDLEPDVAIAQCHPSHDRGRSGVALGVPQTFFHHPQDLESCERSDPLEVALDLEVDIGMSAGDALD
jgi:hypothetical protein